MYIHSALISNLALKKQSPGGLVCTKRKKVQLSLALPLPPPPALQGQRDLITRQNINIDRN